MIKNFFNVAGADAVKRIAEWIRHKFYTKTEIDDMLSAGMKYKVVNELPATGEAGTVYLVPKQSAGTGDVYDEYIYVDGSFEHIGSTEIDLSNYYTKAEADNLLGDKVDKESGKGLSTEDFTTAEKTKLGGIEAGAEVNVQSDWNQGDSTKDDYIKNKPTLRQPSADGTAGQYLKSNGSGNAPSWETMDTAPTANSTKAVTSGGVKTALDGKQASISITNSDATPVDTTNIIMQNSGSTSTTSFLRMTMQTVRGYFNNWLYGLINLPYNTFYSNNRRFDAHVHGLWWGADKRFVVTWKTYSSQTQEVVFEATDTMKSQLFNENAENYGVHPVDGEYDVITIEPKDGQTKIIQGSYGQGRLLLIFYNTSYPSVAPTIRIYGGRSGQKAWTTLSAPTKPANSVFQYVLTQEPALFLEKIEITIQGRTIGTGNEKGVHLSNIDFIGFRSVITEMSAVTKYAVDQQLYGNITAPKLITRDGTSSQYLRGDGSLTTLSTSPTSGSGIPITSGGVYTALNDKQSRLTLDIPDNSGYRVMQLIADVTDSFNTPNYTISGLVGYIYQWRYGGTGTIPHRITAIGGHDADNVYLYSDSDIENRTILPYLIKYDNRYYIALKKTGSSRTGIRLVGYWTNILSTPINLYANSTASKWYSDSGRTMEVSFEIVKSYSRYPNAYLDFGGTASQVVLGTGELKTIDSSVASGSSNLVTSGAVYTAINGIDTSGKVNLQPDFTASQIDYSAGNVGKWQKVLRFPEGADLVINMKKTAMGSDSTSTLWFSSSSMGDSYTSLFGNHSVRFVHDGGYVFLVLACRKSTYEPIESYTFQIAHSSVPMSDIVAVTDASPITATPKEPNIVYRAPITTGAVSFNVNSSAGAGSVSMTNHNDFLGNMTSEATNGVVVTMSGATEGQIYRFVFTRNITGGVTFKQSNVAYCTIQGDVNAGDTITLTAVSNTADGWLYEQESAGIESSDGSNIVEYNGSTADVRVNWEKLPADLVRNNEWTSSVGHRVLAIGEGASADTASNNVAIGKNADASGNSATCVGGDSEASGTYGTALGYGSIANAIGATAFGANAKADGYYGVAIGGTQSNARTTAKSYAVAVGAGSYADASSVVIGYGSNAEATNSVVIGGVNEVEGNNSIVIGRNAISESDGAIAIGKNIQIPYGQTHVNSVTIGNDTNSFGNGAVSIGNEACTAHEYSIAIGEKAKVCRWDNGGDYVSRAEEMNLQSFTVDGEKRKFYRPATAGDVTVTFSGGQTATVNVSKGTLFIVNDATAPNITAIFNGILLDDRYYDTMNGSVNLSSYTITDIPGLNAYAIDIQMPLAYVDTSEVSNARIIVEYAAAFTAEGCALGHDARSYGGYALGRGAVTMYPRQTVVGQYNVPSERDYFQVGYGNGETQRRNILTIDSDERLNVSAYVGGTQTIEMNQQDGSLSNITKSVYKIKWGGTGTIRLTLGTGGCVEGQRVSIAAVTNDVVIFGTTNLIPVGTFGDFLFLDGAWMPSSGVWRV